MKKEAQSSADYEVGDGKLATWGERWWFYRATEENSSMKKMTELLGSISGPSEVGDYIN